MCLFLIGTVFFFLLEVQIAPAVAFVGNHTRFFFVFCFCFILLLFATNDNNNKNNNNNNNTNRQPLTLFEDPNTRDQYPVRNDNVSGVVVMVVVAGVVVVVVVED